MEAFRTRPLFFALAFSAALVTSMVTGCASGGFKLTREYARWVNSQQIVIRIILYIFTSVVFAITLLVDLVVFNTIDFWNGQVAAGNYMFQQDGMNYYVQHEFQGEQKLRRSTIVIESQRDKKRLQEVVVAENLGGEIELFVDGKLRAKVQNISELPLASVYDANGKLLRTDIVGAGTEMLAKITN